MRFFTIVATIPLLALSVVSAEAQATRTWVSGVGDDANPCSRTAPCKTFAGAISKTAPKGEINALDPAGFGAVTITKSITIDGGAGIAGVLVSGTNAIVISAAATDVVRLRNLDFNGLGAGLSAVLVNTVGAVEIENSQIYGFTKPAVNFAPSQAADSKLILKDTVITGNTDFGILVAPTSGGHAAADIVGVTSSRNKAGVRAQDNAIVEVVNSVFSANSNAGVTAVSTAAATAINVKTSVTSSNQIGVAANGASASVTMSNVAVYGNSGSGLSTSGGSIISFGNNQISNNGANGSPTQTLPQQ